MPINCRQKCTVRACATSQSTGSPSSSRHFPMRCECPNVDVPQSCSVQVDTYIVQVDTSGWLWRLTGRGRIIRGAALVYLIGRTPANGESPICQLRLLNLMASAT